MGKRSKREEGEKMKQKVLETIKKYGLIEDGDRLVLGVSGGPDSICMLDVLNKINKNRDLGYSFTIIVAHINHLIREEAKEDEEYVKEFCNKNKIDFFSKSIDVQKIANNSKIGTEEAGRKVRYDFFEEVLNNPSVNANKIAIAHNKNDKVETIIMNVLRGSGVSGLKGIEPKRGKYIRPLIECERVDIERYCAENNLEPRIDKTNFENIYTRNKIRNVVIPYIKREFNPNIINTIDRLSNLVQQENCFIENQVEQRYKEMLLQEKEDEIILDLKKFNNMEQVIKSRILLYTITRLFGSSKGIEKVHIEDVIKLCSNNIGNKYLTPNKKIKILVKNHKIYFLKQEYGNDE